VVNPWREQDDKESRVPNEDNVTCLPWITDKKVALAEIRRIAKEDSESLIFLDHAIDRQEHRDISNAQVLNVLKNGTVTEPIEWDTKKERGWKCKLTRSTAGKMVSVVVKIVQRQGSKCLVITVLIGDDYV